MPFDPGPHPWPEPHALTFPAPSSIPECEARRRVLKQTMESLKYTIHRNYPRGVSYDEYKDWRRRQYYHREVVRAELKYLTAWLTAEQERYRLERDARKAPPAERGDGRV
jgi:hypothetical protein